MKKILILLILGFAILMIAACGGNDSDVTLPERIPTYTQIPLTQTNSPLPAATVTATPEPTQQPTPTLDAIFEAEISTMEAMITKNPELGNYYSRIKMERGYGTMSFESLGLSPNGKWVVLLNHRDSYGLSIFSLEDNRRWDVFYNEFVPDFMHFDDGSMDIVHWSKDGTYVYLSTGLVGSGGCGEFWRDHDNLFRFNLNSGTWVDTQMGSEYSFSTNDKYLAYLRGQEVVIFEFINGQEKTALVPEDFPEATHFTWSPDNKQIIYSSSMENDETGLNLVLVNIEDMSQTILLENDERFLYPFGWPALDLVILSTINTDFCEYGYEKYVLDIQTNTITKLTP